jgi:hypothetical protein
MAGGGGAERPGENPRVTGAEATWCASRRDRSVFLMTALASSTTAGTAQHIEAYFVLALMVFVLAVGVMSIFSPRWRHVATRAICLPVGSLVGLYLVGRAVAEFFIIHYSDPASYAKDWGGPSLAGVFAVHAGPGVAVLIAASVWLYRRKFSPAHPAGSPAGIAAGSPRQPQTTPCG